MKWLTDWLRHVGQVLTGKAEWIEKQEADVREHFAAFNETVRKMLLASFVIGIVAGWILRGASGG